MSPVETTQGTAPGFSVKSKKAENAPILLAYKFEQGMAHDCRQDTIKSLVTVDEIQVNNRSEGGSLVTK